MVNNRSCGRTRWTSWVSTERATAADRPTEALKGEAYTGSRSCWTPGWPILTGVSKMRSSYSTQWWDTNPLVSKPVRGCLWALPVPLPAPVCWSRPWWKWILARNTPVMYELPWSLYRVIREVFSLSLRVPFMHPFTSRFLFKPTSFFVVLYVLY